jgi:hypothetical protein
MSYKSKEEQARYNREWYKKNKGSYNAQRRESGYGKMYGATYYKENGDLIRAAMRENYKKKTDYYKLKYKKYRAAKLVEINSVLNPLKSQPCADCQLAFSPICMDFDHLRNKRANVAQLVSSLRPLEEILSEVAKCELVCACCHRTRTVKRKGGKVKRNSLAILVDELKSSPCHDCGKVFPPECMDFDHRDPAMKKIGIGFLRTMGVAQKQVLLDEIAKCDLVCACCHRIRTGARY